MKYVFEVSNLKATHLKISSARVMRGKLCDKKIFKRTLFRYISCVLL